MKKNRTCVDSTLEELSKLQRDPRLTCRMKDQIQTLELELGFLQTYIWWLSVWNGALFRKYEDSESLRKLHTKSTMGKAIRKGPEKGEFEEWEDLVFKLLDKIQHCYPEMKQSCEKLHLHKNFESLRKSHIKATLGKAIGKNLLYQSGVSAIEKGEFQEWDDLVFKLLDKIQQCRPKMKQTFQEVIHSWNSYKLSTSEIRKILEINFVSLDHFVRYYSDNLLPILDDMKKKADLLMKLLHFAGKWCRYTSAWYELRHHIGKWTSGVGIDCLYLYSVTLEEEFKEQNKEDKQSSVASNLVYFLSASLKNMMPFQPKAMSACIEILTASKEKSSPSDILLMGEILLDLVDLPLDSPAFHVKKDSVDNLWEALIFLISFLVDSPKTNKNPADGELILTRAKDVLYDTTSYITSQIEEDVTEEHNSLILLPDLLQEVITLKTEVKDLYIPDISTFHFPRTDVPGFINSLLIDLKEMLECPRRSSSSFLKHQISKVQEEFLSLRPLLKNVVQLQNEHNGLEDLWIQIANVSHHARDAVNSLFYRIDSIWQDVICLSDVTEEIKQIKCDIEKIQQNHQMYDARVIHTEMSSDSLLPVQDNTSRIKELVVGFKDEEKNIIDHLLGGTSKLHIVAICGMGGLGKTTLARKVYNDPSVQSHFDKYAWCTVSQAYRRRKIFFDILSAIVALDDQHSKMEEEDLAELLYKSLKGRRYLIILDDIWDIRAWNAVETYFPNDYNGSRIIFTTRIRHLALQANSNSSFHSLRPLSNEESWELFEMIVFQNHGCPVYLLQIGNRIVDHCEGLPLAIVLIAGLLSRIDPKRYWWSQIALSLGSQIAGEGGMNIVELIIELSYKYLPEFLKPCFLYFGALQEDKAIRVQKLIQLWISEGFVQEHKKEFFEDMAKQYLMDLVARSLVTVTKRSSNGGIKECAIHDLLREFCLAKAEKEFFLRVVRENVISDSSWQALCKHYRLCIQTNDWRYFFHSLPSHPVVHSLLFSLDNTFGSFEWDQYFSFCEYKFLRLLDLEDVKVLCDFPEEIAVLVLLRYLAIRCTNTSIPPSVANLGNLEFFRVRGTRSGFRLPDTIWEMKRLRHVDISTCIASSETFSQLDNVQSFSVPCFSCEEDVQNLLRRIPRVRKLRCELRQSRDQDMEGNQFPSLNFESHLESLNVIYSGRQLSGCEFKFPLTLRKLTLKNFRLPWREIAVIAKLPNLEVLKLLENAFKDECWMVEDYEFTNLKFLKLCKLNLREWKVSLNALTCLQRLVVEECKNLEEIPDSFGVIPTLMMIQVHGCSFGAESSAKRIQEEQLDFGNEDFAVYHTKST